MVTRAEVAALAGTSTAVVSYVVNDGPRPVAVETRRRVLDAIERLGYRPNRVAQALRGRRSYVLGMIVPDISNPFYAELARAIEKAAEASGYTLVIGNSEQDATREVKYVRAFVDRQVDGLFLIGSSASNELYSLLPQIDLPLLFLDRRFDQGPANHFLGIDGVAGGALATTHLLNLGHRRIVGMFGPPLMGVDRATGYIRAMSEWGLAPDTVYAAQFARDAAYNAARDILSGDHVPSAIFASNDVAAFSVIRAAVDLGMSVPGDLAVVGFDDIQQGRYSVPRLTTVAQPIRELGHAATTYLISLVEGLAGDAPGPRLIDPVLVVRESCGGGLARSLPYRPSEG